MKLEVGSGYHPTPGFVHLDVNPALPVDVVGSAWPLPFRTGSVDELRAVDVLEHLSYRDTDRALREWARVIRPGGRLYVQVPDAERIMVEYARVTRSPKRPSWLRTMEGREASALDGAQWRLLGGHLDGVYAEEGDDFRWNAHYSLWSALSLRTELNRAGLSVASCLTNDHPNLCCWAVKP